MSGKGAFILAPAALVDACRMMAGLSYESESQVAGHFRAEFSSDGTTTSHYGQNWQIVAGETGPGANLRTALANGRFFPDETDAELEARLGDWLDMTVVNGVYAAFALLEPYTDRSIRLMKDPADLLVEFDPAKVTVFLTETGMGGEVREVLSRVGIVPAEENA